MRPNRFDFDKKPPFFRPPKYTGITLSLLSIFVLVSMLAVWEKMANLPDIPVINLLAWEKSREPLEMARIAYQNEASCVVNPTYLSLTELSSLFDPDDQPIDKLLWDILLIPKTKSLNSLLTHQQYESQGIVAYFNEPNQIEARDVHFNQPTPLTSLINRANNNVEARHFLRFLKAPTRGQVEFGMNGWIGVDADHWDMRPLLKIYAIESIKAWLNPIAQNFAKKEGLKLSISFLEEKSLQASLQILTKANNKNYLPDILSLPHSSQGHSWLESDFFELNCTSVTSGVKFSFHIRKRSPLLKTAQKFSRVLSENQ